MTIPDEAVQAAVDAYGEEAKKEINYFPVMMRAALTAALPFLTGVKVKALTWRSEPPYHMARTKFGGFYCIEAIWNENKFVHAKLDGSFSSGKIFPNLEEAKSSAQADYSARILSAIEVAPSPRAQALEEAAKLLEREADELDGLVDSVSHHLRSKAKTIRALSSKLVADGWLPIETAPKDGTAVDLWCKHVLHGSTRAADAKFNGREWLIGDCSERLNPDWIPTHWRTLPASPGASE